MRNLRRRKLGQAIVEFALAATVIFFLLAAAVDLGLIFFTVQGLHNAAQEGATYGSRWLIMGADASGRQIRVLDENAIRERVRKESGTKGGIGFVNLLDLNHDGIPDVGPDNNAVVGANGTTYQTLPGGARVIDQFIQIQLLWDANADGDPMDDLVGGQPQLCTDPSQQSPCFVRVTVMLNYQTVFPLTPGFARTTTLRSSYIFRLRDSFSEGSPSNATPIIQTVTPLPSPTPLPTFTPTPTACPSLGAPSLSGAKSGNNASLAWGAIAGATSYQIYQNVGAGSFASAGTVAAPATNASIGLSGSSGAVNQFYVVAINSCGQPGAQSNAVSVTK